MNDIDIHQFQDNPDEFLDVLHKLIDGLKQGHEPTGLKEKDRQLKEISRTISKLKAASVPIPDGLRQIKMSLISQVSAARDHRETLSQLERGLAECLQEIRSMLGRTPPSTKRRRHSKRKPRGTTTERLVLREHIIRGLQEHGGCAKKNDLLDYMEKALAGTLLPGDLERRSKDQIVWRNNACWERFRMIGDGILKRGSPRGVWELSEG